MIYVELFIPKAKYTFFSSAHGTFSKIDHMKRHKTSLNKFKKIEMISNIFSDQKGLKVKTNLKEKTQNTQNMEIEQHAIKQYPTCTSTRETTTKTAQSK